MHVQSSGILGLQRPNQGFFFMIAQAAQATILLFGPEFSPIIPLLHHKMPLVSMVKRCPMTQKIEGIMCSPPWEF